MSTDQWEKVAYKDFIADVNKDAAASYKLVGHQFQQRKRCPYPVCKSCGLVRLRNRLTGYAERYGCDYRKHAAFKAEEKRGLV